MFKFPLGEYLRNSVVALAVSI